MLVSRRWLIAFVTALYLYFLLPITATMFYELYHVTHIEPIYWGYMVFKAAGSYLGVYEHRLLACLLVAAAIILIPSLFKSRRRAERLL